ncbi:MAG: S9 family peptidase [Planctomycetota bacterium]
MLLLAATSLAQDAPKRLSFEDTRLPIQWSGRLPGARWAWDGAHVELERGKASIWIDPATNAEVPPKPRPDAGDDEAEDDDGERPSPDAFAVRVWEGDLWLEPRRGGGGGRGPGGRRPRGGNRGAPGEDARQLTTDGVATGSKREAHLSPAGTQVSFVRGGDLFVLDVDGGHEWQVTTGGSDELLHGVLDWVYQEEVYGRGNFQGHWWSPDGAAIAVLTLDESPVREFTIVDHVPDGFLDRERAVRTEVANYPKAGDPNPFASLSVVHTGARKTVPVDLSAYPDDVLVVRVGWTDDAATLLVTLQDRIQTWAELCAVDPATGKLTRWIREESPTWVNRPEPPRFLPDGTFLWLSERTGYQHLYRYRADGTLMHPVTAGDWQVRDVVRVDAERGLVWFEGTRDGATGRHLYRTDLAGAGAAASGVVLLTPGVGTHSGRLSPDGRWVLDTWSAMDRLPTARLLDGETGRVVRELGTAEPGASAEYAFAPKERLAIPARDGYLLDATVMLPTELAPGRSYPVFLPTYSGPDAPTVRDAWSHSTYHQFLAQQGFVVLQVNVRSASGRGQQHTGTCYRQLGVQELQDLEDAVAWVCRERHGDPARVAIDGWSYGGFMAAYALTHSKAFALGIAGAGVYDWRLYDTIYTERYMRTPEENKTGYDATSVIKAAKDLSGHLVLLHGTMDDNVHMQNCMQLLWELQKAGKQNFELMMYPRSQHGPAREVAGHVREFQWRALRRLLDPAWKPER